MKRQVNGRLFMVVLGPLLTGAAFFDPGLGNMLIQINGWPAQLCMLTLLALSIIAGLDTLVNDCLSERYSFETGARFRQTIWGLIALTYAGIGFATWKTTNAAFIATVYFTYGGFCLTVAFNSLLFKKQDAEAVIEKQRTDFGALNA